MNQSRYIITGWNTQLKRSEVWTNISCGFSKEEVIWLYQRLLNDSSYNQLRISKLCELVTVYDLKD